MTVLTAYLNYIPDNDVCSIEEALLVIATLQTHVAILDLKYS